MDGGNAIFFAQEAHVTISTTNNTFVKADVGGKEARTRFMVVNLINVEMPTVGFTSTAILSPVEMALQRQRKL
jgi:hypothetical protein